MTIWHMRWIIRAGLTLRICNVCAYWFCTATVVTRTRRSTSIACPVEDWGLAGCGSASLIDVLKELFGVLSCPWLSKINVWVLSKRLQTPSVAASHGGRPECSVMLYWLFVWLDRGEMCYSNCINVRLHGVINGYTLSITSVMVGV